MQEGNDNLSEKPKRKNKPGAGRPRKEVDESLIFNLAKIHCTMAEISAMTDISVSTLENNFYELIQKGKEEGKASLRRSQYLAAQKGNVAMMIWLGKQLLGQRERADLDIQSGVTVVWDERIGKL
jgi:hypothetical protein